jgi:hypothetical protein
VIRISGWLAYNIAESNWQDCILRAKKGKEAASKQLKTNAEVGNRLAD